MINVTDGTKVGYVVQSFTVADLSSSCYTNQRLVRNRAPLQNRCCHGRRWGDTGYRREALEW